MAGLLKSQGVVGVATSIFRHIVSYRALQLLAARMLACMCLDFTI